MWFGTYRGVSRYEKPLRDGESWITYTRKDGLANNNVISILQDKEGVIWIGTSGGGVSRFDGKSWQTYTQKDGLAHDTVRSILQDKEGVIWIGTQGGVSRYDGNSWQTYTQEDGLAHNDVLDILQDKEGIIWFGTFSGGISRFDGRCFQTIDSRDGLAGDAVYSLCMDKSGQVWAGTTGGVVRFMPKNKIQPPVTITQILADEKTYTQPGERLNLRAGVRRVAFGFHAPSFKTRPGRMKYFYQLVGKDTDWQGPTNEETIEYFNLKPGAYTFEVQAVDRDLNYSEIASLELTLPPVWHQIGWIRVILVGGLVALLIWSIVAGVRYSTQRREAQRLEQEAQQLRDEMLQQERQSRQALEAKNEQISVLNEQLQDDNLRLAAELEITERIQRMILPSAEELKAIADLDIAGYMEPADDVGGDYYDVMQREGTVAISIGDVTGHGLESGLVMLMTQTAVQALLHSGETDPVRLLDTLNRTIYNNVQRIKTDKNLTLCLLDYQSGELKLSGQHEEMIVVRRDGQVELVDTIDLGFPIGLDDDIADFIDQTTVQLESGDGVVLYTDGITEAENTSGEQYGLERLCEIVSQHWSQSAEEIKEAVIADVRQHIGEHEMYDDITLVVLKQK